MNLKSAFLSMKHAIPAMAATGGGSIVNISSISSLRYLNKPYVAYYTTKAAMNHMTRVTAAQYAPDQVRVNAIVPGLMDTPMAVDALAGALGVDRAVVSERRDSMVPLGGRQGTADDVANAVLFLASDEARFVTAAVLPVDGGQSARIG